MLVLEFDIFLKSAYKMLEFSKNGSVLSDYYLFIRLITSSLGMCFIFKIVVYFGVTQIISTYKM